jgi:hypothetical protein
VVVPDRLTLAEARDQAGDTDLELFNLGLESDKPLRFVVVVPEVGACLVPQEALSHFQAGATEYVAHHLFEWWSKQPVDLFTIRRDAVMIYADDWNKRMVERGEIAQALFGVPLRLRLGYISAHDLAANIAGAVFGVDGATAAGMLGQQDAKAKAIEREYQRWMERLWQYVGEGKLELRSAQGIEFAGPFAEGFFSTAELAASSGLFTLEPSENRKFKAPIHIEIHHPGHTLRRVFDPETKSTTESWFPDQMDAPFAEAKAPVAIRAESTALQQVDPPKKRGRGRPSTPSIWEIGIDVDAEVLREIERRKNDGLTLSDEAVGNGVGAAIRKVLIPRFEGADDAEMVRKLKGGFPDWQTIKKKYPSNFLKK